MRFDRLLWECLAVGRYDYSEESTGGGTLTAALDPRPGETVLLFNLDGKPFRQGEEGVLVCDLLFFYRGPDARAPVLLFVELKGSDHEHAEAQVASALGRVLREMDRSCIGADPTADSFSPGGIRSHRAILRGVVVLAKSGPREVKAHLKMLYEQHGIRFRYHTDALDKRTDLRGDLA